MKKIALLLFFIIACQFVASAQEAGNAAYGNQRRKTSGVSVGNLFSTDPKDSVQSSFIEANVLLNLKADEYVAVFGLAQEGATIIDGNRKIDAQFNEFIAALKTLGLKDSEIFVDFITQNRVYDFGVAGNTAKEKLAGFEVKKNLAVRYKDKSLLEKLLLAASKASIFDLIKVDYLVSDMTAARQQLLAEAAKVIKKKEEDYARLLGLKMRPHSVVIEKYNAFLPSEMYNTYVAYEANNVEGGNNMRVVEKRKVSTFYFNPLHPGEFDMILNPAGVEPVVQVTLYLKVKYVLSS
ncbi:MAG: SIMPL domain-containing protein [Acidobacteria bacterium]|nr:SIMPL domain-containing protein [Acidobacteriota bacterium]